MSLARIGRARLVSLPVDETRDEAAALFGVSGPTVGRAKAGARERTRFDPFLSLSAPLPLATRVANLAGSAKEWTPIGPQGDIGIAPETAKPPD